MTSVVKANKSKDLKSTLYLFIIVLVYKLTLEIGFWYLLQDVYKELNVYKFQFDLWKFLYGLFWTILLFFLINHEESIILEVLETENL